MQDLLHNNGMSPITATIITMGQAWKMLIKGVDPTLQRKVDPSMSVERFAVIKAISVLCESRPFTMTADIARFIGGQSQSVTGMLNRLEQEGLATRRPKRKGRPYTEIRLTETGENLLRRTEQAVSKTLSTSEKFNSAKMIVSLGIVRDAIAELAGEDINQLGDE